MTEKELEYHRLTAHFYANQKDGGEAWRSNIAVILADIARQLTIIADK